MRLVAACMGLLLGAGAATAQDDSRVEVEVTAVSGQSLYIDRGRQSHIEPGDELLLHPAGQPPIHAVIAAVSRTSARADLPGGTSPLGIVPGTRGEIRIPSSRITPTEEEEAEQGADRDPWQKQPVTHPPWQNTLEEWDQDQPLLAPAFGGGAASRTTRILGHAFTQLAPSWTNGADNRYLLGRLGTDLEVLNPASLGGRLRFRGEIWTRDTHLAGQPDQDTTRGRLDWLSYRWGDELGSPFRVEVGRFFQSTFPEFGLLDGAELVLPDGPTSGLGISVGGMPRPFELSGTDDFQTAIFYRDADDRDRLEWGAGYQRSWHDGDHDRDLLYGDLRYRPTQDLDLYSSMWIDFYGSSDTIKSSGPQITEFRLQANYRIDADHGVALSTHYFRWPELLRDIYRSLTPEQVRNDWSWRSSLSSWNHLAEHVRLDAVLDHWRDQDTDGLGGNIRLACRDLLYEGGEVGVSVFRNEYPFERALGFRLYASKRLDGAFLDFAYERSNLESRVSGSSGDLHTQKLHAGLSYIVSPATDLSVNVDYFFGDAQDALSLGLYAQTRF